jgi:hypothetical protein
MSQQTDSRMEEIQTQLAERDRLKTTLMEAQETLGRENYRLDTIEECFERLQGEIGKLESMSLTSIMSSLMGTKAEKIDSLREECQNLETEHRQCDEAVLSLKKQVDQLAAELASFAEVEAEYKTICANDPYNNSEQIHRLEQAIETGSSLISLLSNAYGICNRLRKGPKMFDGCGALLSTVSHVGAEKAAGGVAEQIATSVRYFCTELSKLGLDPENPSDAEMIGEWSQIDRFCDPATLGANANANDWAELETLAACLVTDLQERLGKLTSRRC